MIVVGIVGGVASGKSLVCAQLAQLGAHVLAADPLGHAALRDAAIKRTLVARWGDQVLGADGEIDRPAVARLVFAPGTAGLQERRFLEQLVHPWIEARLRTALTTLAEQEPQAVVVLDAALLVEAGWTDLCDVLVYVDAPADQRRERAAGRGWSQADWEGREAAQASLAKKRELAHWTLDNSASSAETYIQVLELWKRLRFDGHPPVSGSGTSDLFPDPT